jgi:hypothetical protein
LIESAPVVVDLAATLVLRAFALVTALVLVAAALQKLRDWPSFRAVVADYRLLPDALVVPGALAVAAAELLAGVALAVEPLRVPGAWLGSAVIGASTAAVAVNMLRGRTHIDCGCGGIEGRQPLSWALVVRNLVLVAGLVAGTAVTAPLPAGALAYSTLAAATLAGLALYAAASQLIANRPLLAQLIERT